MTTVDKDNIRRLRDGGLGYKAIAARLDLPLDAVKGFCRRNGLTANTAEPTGNACLQCGAALGERPPGAERKKYCSDACRNKWWDSHADLRAREKDRRICAHCNRVFYNRKPRKYCGIPCSTAARFGGAIQ